MSLTTDLAAARTRIEDLEGQLNEAHTTIAEFSLPQPAPVRPRRKSTMFDTDSILACALINDDSFGIAECLGVEHGPALRTRLSQLVNGGRLAENFRPMRAAVRPTVATEPETES